MLVPLYKKIFQRDLFPEVSASLMMVSILLFLQHLRRLINKVVVNYTLGEGTLYSEAEEVRYLILIGEIKETDRPRRIAIEYLHYLLLKLFHRL
jgi:hypothetical protein